MRTSLARFCSTFVTSTKARLEGCVHSMPGQIFSVVTIAGQLKLLSEYAHTSSTAYMKRRKRRPASAICDLPGNFFSTSTCGDGVRTCQL